jgi:hypothetical protein
MRARLSSDKISRMRTVFAALASVALLACNTPNPEGAKKDAPAAAADAKTAPDTKATTPPTQETKTAGDPTNPNVAADSKTGDAAAATTQAPPDPTAAPADSAGAPPTDAAAPAADKAKLLDEAKAKKTSDTRAKKALDEAEKAGATPRELAEAANARGEALFGEAERATTFFEWARDKDTTYPEPVFNLAKQSANAGEIPKTVEHLKEVSKRGGKKLLKQVGFDPTFEVVKDDPEVQKLLK